MMVKRKRIKMKKVQVKPTKCPECGFRIRGKKHEEGRHHRGIRL